MSVTSPSALWCVAIALLVAVPSSALDLKPHTLAVFERYVRAIEARMGEETAGRTPLLWVDRQPESSRKLALQRLRNGEVVVEKLPPPREGNRVIEVEDGLVHHWIGTVFLPGATLDKVVPFVQAYADYPKHFGPMIQQASVKSRDGDRFVVHMRTSKTKFGFTVVLDADYTIEYRRLDPNRLFTRSITSNIHEVSNPGKTERRKPAEQGTGYLWRLNTYCSFEQKPEGTYEQCESISLTTGVPLLLPFIKPIVNAIPRETLEFTLGQVQKALR